MRVPQRAALSIWTKCPRAATRDDPLRLALRGRVDKQLAYAIAVEGGPLRLLQEGSAPWPFTLDFEAPGTRLHASGELDAASGGARFDFGVGTEDLAQVARLLDTKLPRFGVAALYGTGVAAADAVEFADLRGALGKSELSGHLAFAFGGARPRVTGALAVATLDLRPFLVAAQGPQDQSLDFDQLKRHSLPLRDLVPVDVDVDLSVGQWLGLPVDLRDARLELRADARGMRVPIGATIAGIPFSGHFELDTAAPTPTLAVRFAAKDWALGDPARVLTGASGIEGTLGRIGLRLGGRGETLGSLVRDLELALAVTAARLSYGNVAGGRSIAFTFDTLDVAVRRGERLRAARAVRSSASARTSRFAAARCPTCWASSRCRSRSTSRLPLRTCASRARSLAPGRRTTPTSPSVFKPAARGISRDGWASRRSRTCLSPCAAARASQPTRGTSMRRRSSSAAAS